MTTTAAPGERRVRETRELPPFERIDLRDRANWVDLIAEPGDHEEPQHHHRAEQAAHAGRPVPLDGEHTDDDRDRDRDDVGREERCRDR